MPAGQRASVGIRKPNPSRSIHLWGVIIVPNGNALSDSQRDEAKAFSEQMSELIEKWGPASILCAMAWHYEKKVELKEAGCPCATVLHHEWAFALENLSVLMDGDIKDYVRTHINASQP